jgi:Fe-S cluster assembly protein SufD
MNSVNKVGSSERCTVGSLNPEVLLAGSREAGEPHWLLKMRAVFLRRFRETGLPAPFEEDWRGTDLRDFGLDRSTVIRAGVGPSARLAASATHLSPSPTQCSGPGELTMLPLGEAVRRKPDLLQGNLFAGFDPETAPPLAALNAACLSGGAFFHLPRDAEMPGTARAAWQPSGGEAAHFPHNLVVLEGGSRGSLVESFSGPGSDDRAGVCCSVTEVVVGPGAQLDILTLIDQDQAAGTCHSAVARVAAGGRLRWYLGSTGGRMVRADIEVTLAGPGAESRIVGIGVGRGRRHLDHRTVQRHAAPDTRSTIVFGTLLRGRSSSIYRGLIGMDQGALRGDAYQKNDNLLLERGPTAQAIPKLEILTDDVKCSHGSTVGRLSEEELFYATARGIPRSRARDLVAEGFIRRVLTGGGEWNTLTEELFGKVRGAVIDNIQPYDPSA